MTYTELCEMKDTWRFLKAIPRGKIINREQYDYMIAYEKKTNFGFYWTDNDRHTPTYEECYGKYLDTVDFFGGASFFFCIRDYYCKWDEDFKRIIKCDQPWEYGEYGKIDLEN